MKYRVTHDTEYYYDDDIPLCHNVVHLRPRETWRQKCLASEVTVTPTPAVQREFVDFFGNNTDWFSLQEPHEVLKIHAVSEVEVDESPLAGIGGPPWEQVAAALVTCTSPALFDVKEYTFDTPDASAHPDLADYARPSFPKDRPIVEAVMDLTRRIYDDFEFDSSATSIGTPALEVLKHRRGVCQDFAHLQVGCLRSLGLAGRYVSGYVLTQPPPGQKRLVGCDASHAWIAAFAPGIGWVDFDPTNALIPHGEHVTLGWGRDYDDVCPVKGVIVGGHRHSMYYGVTVEPIDEPDETEGEDGAAAGANGSPGSPKAATAAAASPNATKPLLSE